MAPLHPRYIPKDPEDQSPDLPMSSLIVLRTLDNESFLATQITDELVKDRGSDIVNTRLAPCLLPSVTNSLSLILNHPNIISLIDIQPITAVEGAISAAGPNADITIWEDMDAGCLSYLLPSMSDMPELNDEHGWHQLSSVNHCRFSLPESLCWHVLRSMAKALLWLHHGVKETEGIPDEWERHDEDWQAILIRDVSPGQIWFKKPKGHETYGQCKLGGFAWAKVTGSSGATVAAATRYEGASREKQFFWPPVSNRLLSRLK
jgi:serine/threonine protein kinase